MIKRDVRLIGVDGKGRVAEDNACAHRHGGGAWAIDLKIPLLRQWQHETCDPLALRSRLIGANRGFSILTARCERRYRRALIRVSFTRVSARFAWPSAVLLEGGGTGPKAAGARTRHNRNSNRQQHLTYGSEPWLASKALQFGHTRARKCLVVGPQWHRKWAFTQVPLTEAPLNGLKRD